MTLDTTQYKEILEKERGAIEGDLKTVGRKNPSNPEDWEGVPSKLDITSADRNEVADNIESYEENTAILKELETRLKDTREALQRIEAGTFGKCTVCSKEIEKERLDVNPSSTTCMEHL